MSVTGSLSAQAPARRWYQPPAQRRYQPAMIGLTLIALVVAALTLSPVGYVVGQAISVGWAPTLALLVSPATLGLLENTVTLTVAVVAASLVIGGGIAWLVERTQVPGRRMWGVLAALPIAVPAFVAAYAWVSLVPAMAGFGGAFVVMTLASYPLVYLPVTAALRSMDPALEEAGSVLGCGAWGTFWRVVIPQIRPALLGGALLVALEVLTEFGAFSMLNYSTFTTTIYDQYNISFNGPTASLLALVLVFGCLILLIAELRLRGTRRYARLGRGTARPRSQHALGRMLPAAVFGLGTIAAAALGVPAGVLVYWLSRGTSSALPLDSLVTATGSSLALSLGAAAVTTLLALPVAILAVRHRTRLGIIIERCTYLARGLPGVVIALALVFISITVARPLYQSAFVVVIAYAIVFLPLALIGVRGAIERVTPAIEDAARSLGKHPLAVFVRVTLPLVSPGIGAAAALVFLSTMTELTVTLMLAPPGVQTLAMVVWTDTNNLAYGAAAPYAALMVAISAVPTYLLTRRLGPVGAR